MIGRPTAAAIGLLILSLAGQGLSQTATPDQLADIRARIAEKGQATVLVTMEVAETMNNAPATETRSREGKSVQQNRPMAPRERLSRVREGIAAQRARIESSLMGRGIAMQRTYKNLPFFVTTVDDAGLEHLLREPGVAAIALNRARRGNRDLVAKVIVPDSELAANQAAAQTTATAEQVAAERALRAQAASGDFAAAETSGPGIAAKPLLDTSVEYINADQAWDQGVIGSGTVIAILDDGIDANHEMFAGKIVAEACFSDTFDSVDDSLCANGDNTQIGFGSASACPTGICDHGSHVAGIAAGNDQTGGTTRRGVAYGADLVPIQVFTLVNDTEACDGEESCQLSYDSATVAALNHVIDLTDTLNIAAVNMSLGAELTDTACDFNVHKTAIDSLRSLGVLTAIAAGNAEAVGEVENPGCISTAITVSSVIVTVPDNGVNHAPMVDVLAPGVAIVSAVPNNSYAAFSGTSMATPHAAGAIALLKSANPTATADEIEQALESTGTETSLSEWTWTTPLINVSAALDSLGGTSSSGPAGRVVANVFASNRTKAESFVRFYNPGTSLGSVSVNVVDDLTGETAGTYTRNVAAGATVQVSMADIEQAASPQIIPAAGDTQSYSLHVDATFSGYVQHVLWNPAGGSLTNMSGCDNGVANSGRDLNNIHTSVLDAYPSYVQVYNAGSEEANPVFTVRDARNGSSLGNFNLTTGIAPNTSAVVFVSDLVEFFGGTPASNQFHLNLQLQSGFTGFAQHIVDNLDASLLTNMTAKCDL